jgi:hypothetical protein
VTDDDVKRDLERRRPEEIEPSAAEFRHQLQLQAKQSVEVLLNPLQPRFAHGTLH